MAQDSPVVLVVDDEPGLADLLTAWLSAEYTVKTAYSGRDALQQLDETVDVTLLDRRMPELSGEDVAGEVRARGHDCLVALVTAVEPDVDILDVEFDEYVTKPVTRERIREVVAELLSRKSAAPDLRRYYALDSKRAVLSAQHSASVRDDEAYQALLAELETLAADIDCTGVDTGEVR